MNKALASGMVEGSLAALDRAWYVMMLPQGLIAQSVATVVFPTFAAQVAAEDGGAAPHARQVLRSVLFLAIPATVGLIVLRLPIVRLISRAWRFQCGGQRGGIVGATVLRAGADRALARRDRDAGLLRDA